ncbi:hypothetical protein M1D34_29800 (plasmid) [Ensifer sp. D2-11]
MHPSQLFGWRRDVLDRRRHSPQHSDPPDPLKRGMPQLPLMGHARYSTSAIRPARRRRPPCASGSRLTPEKIYVDLNLRRKFGFAPDGQSRLDSPVRRTQVPTETEVTYA